MQALDCSVLGSAYFGKLIGHIEDAVSSSRLGARHAHILLFHNHMVSRHARTARRFGPCAAATDGRRSVRARAVQLVLHRRQRHSFELSPLVMFLLSIYMHSMVAFGAPATSLAADAAAKAAIDGATTVRAERPVDIQPPPSSAPIARPDSTVIDQSTAASAGAAPAVEQPPTAAPAAAPQLNSERTAAPTGGQEATASRSSPLPRRSGSLPSSKSSDNALDQYYMASDEFTQADDSVATLNGASAAAMRAAYDDDNGDYGDEPGSLPLYTQPMDGSSDQFFASGGVVEPADDLSSYGSDDALSSDIGSTYHDPPTFGSFVDLTDRLAFLSVGPLDASLNDRSDLLASPAEKPPQLDRPAGDGPAGSPEAAAAVGVREAAGLGQAAAKTREQTGGAREAAKSAPDVPPSDGISRNTLYLQSNQARAVYTVRLADALTLLVVTETDASSKNERADVYDAVRRMQKSAQALALRIKSHYDSHMSMTVFTPAFPGLVYFILINRSVGIAAVPCDVGSTNPPIRHADAQQLMRNFVARVQRRLEDGCMAGFEQRDRFLMGYRVWFESDAQRVLPVHRRLNLRSTFNTKLYRELAEGLLSHGKSANVMCWELYTLHTADVTVDLAAKQCMELPAAIRERVPSMRPNADRS